MHNSLGHWFLEIVYKDALELVFEQDGILFEREKGYNVCFRGKLLNHKFFADFVAFDKIILEVKSVVSLTGEQIALTINYLKVSGNALLVIVHFSNICNKVINIGEFWPEWEHHLGKNIRAYLCIRGGIISRF